MSDPYLGEIQAFPFSFAANGFNRAWLPCFGQLLPIQRYATLYSLIGTAYGGNGTTQFALPNLNGAVTIGQGKGAGLSQRVIGQRVGNQLASVTSVDQLGAHTHDLLLGSKDAAGRGALVASRTDMAAINPDTVGFTTDPDDVTLAPSAISNSAGQGLPHDNVQPVQALIWCMAVEGLFPAFSS